MISNQRLNEIDHMLIERGFNWTAQHLGVSEKSLKRYIHQIEANRRELPDGPKILSFDIETSLIEVRLFRPGKQYVSPQSIKHDWFMHSWAGKWLMEPETFSMAQTPDEAIQKDDKRIVEGMWNLLDEADIVIAHNGIKFDVRKVNTRFIMNGINEPPSSYQVIDTLKEYRRHFGFSSNTQDYLTKMLKLPEKLHTDFGLWERCYEGDAQALLDMEEYNHGDVAGLEELYLKIRPWMKSHPNVALYYDGADVERCPKCGNVHLMWDGEYRTPAGRYNAFRCGDCKTIGRSRISNMTAEQRKVLTVSTAR